MSECPNIEKCKLIQHLEVPMKVIYPRWWYCEVHKQVVGLEHEESKALIEKKWKENMEAMK